MGSLLDGVYTREEQAEMFETPLYIYESNEYTHITGIPQEIALSAFYEDEENERKFEELNAKQEMSLSKVFEDIRNGKTLFTFTRPRLARNKTHFARLLYVYTPSLYTANAVQISCFVVHEKSFTKFDFIADNHTTQETVKDFIIHVPMSENGLTFYEPWND